jgi:sporulation protein YlmC with PRC-barrel domain
MMTLALSELLGSTVYDPSGAASGRVREVTLAPQEDRSKISSLIVKTKTGNRMLSFTAVSAINGGVRATTAAGEWPAVNGTEGLFLLERDLLDQQVIDINGRKVVRVNDVDLQVESQKEKDPSQAHPVLRVHSVDVGARGAIRRLLRGVAPKSALHALLARIPPRSILWSTSATLIAWTNECSMTVRTLSCPGSPSKTANSADASNTNSRFGAGITGRSRERLRPCGAAADGVEELAPRDFLAQERLVLRLREPVGLQEAAEDRGIELSGLAAEGRRDELDRPAPR